MTFWENTKVLITGGASFIGSHLVEKLIKEGAKIRVADDLSSGRLENLSNVREKVQFLKGDLKDLGFAKKACKGMSVVFHLAASHGGRGYIDTHPVECAQNMVLDGVVFKEAFKAKVDRICFASSACVYPTNLQDKPKTGNLVCLEEEWADHFQTGKANSDGEYGWAKFMGEMALKAYHKQYGQKCVSCRIFTAYGERENETHAVIALIAKAFAEIDPYVIWGTGEQDRNFTYVGDIATGLIKAAEKIDDGSAVNVGTAEHVTIKQLVEKIFQNTGFRPKRCEFDTSKPVGVFSRAASIKNTKKLLGWAPDTSIDEGLDRTIKWYYAVKDKEEIRKKLGVLLTER
jgi:UDP-glucose 4-epimerase